MIEATITPRPDITMVRTADLDALRRTVGELVLLVAAAYPGEGDANATAVQSLQGLARHVQRRLDAMR